MILGLGLFLLQGSGLFRVKGCGLFLVMQPSVECIDLDLGG